MEMTIYEAIVTGEYYRIMRERREREEVAQREYYNHIYTVDKNIRAARRLLDGSSPIRNYSTSNIYESYNESKICDEW